MLDDLIARLRARSDMNFRNGNHDKRDAYLTAINDVEQIMGLNSIQTVSNNILMPAKVGDVGYNLVAAEDVVVRTGEVSFIKTGVKVKLPHGYWAIITARSSAVFKLQVFVIQGIIDNGFVGELIIPCIAFNKQQIVKAGTSIAQLILFPIVTPPLELVSNLPNTERGENGFGSTGLTEVEDVERTLVNE